MGLFTAARVATGAARAMADTPPGQAPRILPPAPAAAYTIGVSDIPGLLGGWMGRDTAMMVPAFSCGLRTITRTAALMPLLESNSAGEPVAPLGFTKDTYEVGVPRVTTISKTVADLVCEGRAYWFVTEAQQTGYPEHVRHLDPETVSMQPDPDQDTRPGQLPLPSDRVWLVNGSGDPRDGRPWARWMVIDFDTGAPGVLASGWYALRTAISLEAAANTYAQSPLPQVALKSSGGIDLDDTEISELLDGWDTARRTRGTAYLNSLVELMQVGWNSAELQLVEARQHAAVEVARLFPLDPVWVGAGIAGSSLTYANRQDLYQQLLDVSVMPPARVIEQRLSMLTSDRVFRFDTLAFLRANLPERVAAFTAYIAAGVLSPEEVRQLEPIIRRGQISS